MDTPDSYSSAAYSSDDSRPQRPPRRRSRSSDDEEKTKLTDIGQTPEVKEFYRKSRRDLWEDWAPEYVGLAGSAAASAKFALIARREVNVEATDGNVLALHSVIVNSPHIKRALGDVFQGYPGVSTTLKKVEFKAPFQPFFHRWRALQKCVEDEEEVDELARQHVKLLYDVLAPEIKPQIERARDLRKNEVVSFDYLWTLFEPDTEAYARVDDQDRLFLVKNARYEPRSDGSVVFTLKWLFFIDSVTEVEWNEGAFDQLVLPHDYKTIVRAFVEAQMSSASGFDDIIRGKGQGIIMLLSGEPGVGKTLTAESMAEAMKKPLYAMSAGELGITADDVEDSLRRVLEMCTKWQAVLLLDECDIFLEKRRASDLQRNQIVSVFLRLLEYYKGVMLLTTNRVESFDPAFESRIHLTINYPALDFDSRLHVWKVFIDRRKADGSGALEPRQFRLEEEDFKALAKLELNGREIKNVVKTASLLAVRDGAPLGMEHVRAVLRVRRGKPAAMGSVDTGLVDEI
ncbi:hypothetical protein KHU50_000394 [Colletotrichum sp. SAR 10_65]|nr:hypothetical protein KHU50_000394 [Colletotrichum sp. SAR 10_65]